MGRAQQLKTTTGAAFKKSSFASFLSRGIALITNHYGHFGEAIPAADASRREDDQAALGQHRENSGEPLAAPARGHLLCPVWARTGLINGYIWIGLTRGGREMHAQRRRIGEIGERDQNRIAGGPRSGYPVTACRSRGRRVLSRRSRRAGRPVSLNWTTTASISCASTFAARAERQLKTCAVPPFGYRVPQVHAEYARRSTTTIDLAGMIRSPNGSHCSMFCGAVGRAARPTRTGGILPGTIHNSLTGDLRDLFGYSPEPSLKASPAPSPRSRSN